MKDKTLFCAFLVIFALGILCGGFLNFLQWCHHGFLTAKNTVGAKVGNFEISRQKVEQTNKSLCSLSEKADPFMRNQVEKYLGPCVMSD
jgi:hypothetical protein